MRYMEEALPVSKKLSKVQIVWEPCFFVALHGAVQRYHNDLLFIRGEESACSNLYK